ncbi:MAG: glycosyltransferase family 4 protein [Leptolyngbyaceae cyanobacterium bins.302]|nr:glycosyltransferase family 4 protein [Leptolyngbyaceae cyanobacterium bins.302]
MSTLNVPSDLQTRPLRVLSVHNRYQIRGGEEEVRDAERSLLEMKGHLVDIYEDSNDRLDSLGAIQTAINTIWSSQTYKNIKCQLSRDSYGVVHVHNTLPLISPSIYYAAKDVGVPIVQTLHNYRLLCPNALFFKNGQVCEECLGKSIPWPGIKDACYRDNRIASGVVSAMLSVHNFLNTWSEQISLYIALTEFARKKFIEGGIPAKKIVVKPNFVSPDPGIGDGSGRYALYVGRLSVEKGIDVLLGAWKYLDGVVPLKIVGDGPLREQIIQTSQTLSQVEWLGRKPMTDVYDLIGEAMMLIVPSKWYETFGRVVIEAFAKGTPVVVANIGAIAELVDSGRTGLHFHLADSAHLAAQIDWLISHPSEREIMRQESRIEFENKYTAEKNYQQLIEVYEFARSLERVV